MFQKQLFGKALIFIHFLYMYKNKFSSTLQKFVREKAQRTKHLKKITFWEHRR